MKTYTVKNYKGNLVESLKKFSDSYKGMKIVEACEDGDKLKIKAEESEQQKIEETGGKVYAIVYAYGIGDKDSDILNADTVEAICSTLGEAKALIKKHNKEFNERIKYTIREYDLNAWDIKDAHIRDIAEVK